MANNNGQDPTTLDYVSLYVHGLSTEQILKGLSERGLTSDNVVFNDYKTSFDKYVNQDKLFTPEQFTTDFYNQAGHSYDLFKKEQFNNNIASPYEYSPSKPNKLSGKIDYSSLGRIIPPGFNEKGEMVATPEEVAIGRGWMEDIKGEKVPYKDSYIKNLFVPHYPKIIALDDNNVPFVKEVRTDSPEIKREKIISAIGPQSLIDNHFVTIFKGLYNMSIPGLTSTVGSTLEVGGNAWDGLFNKEDKDSWAEITGRKIQDYAAGSIAKPSIEAQQGLFDSWGSFYYNSAQVAAQLVLQRATGGLFNIGLPKATGLVSQKVLDAYRKRGLLNLHTSSGLFGLMAMDNYNQYAKQNGIDPMDIAWQGPIMALAEYGTETFIGPGVVARGTKHIYLNQQVREAIENYGEIFKKELGENTLSNMTKEQSKNYIKGTLNSVKNKYLDLMNKPKSMWGQWLATGTEEMSEELAVQPIQNTVEYINDWRALALNPAAEQGHGMFQNIEDYKYFFNPEYLSRIPSGMLEAAVMGFFGGMAGGAAVLRGKYHSKTINDLVAEGEGQYILKTGREMRSNNKLDFYHLNENNDIITPEMKASGVKSMNDIAYDLLEEEVNTKEAIRKQYRLNKPETIATVGGNLEFLKEAMGYAADIETTKKGITDGTIDKEVEKITIGEKQQLLNDLIIPEQGSKHSKRVNEAVKNNTIFMEQTAQELKEWYAAMPGNIKVDDKLTTSKEYNEQLLNYVSGEFQKGNDAASVKKLLVEKGWNDADIDSAITKAKAERL